MCDEPEPNRQSHRRQREVKRLPHSIRFFDSEWDRIVVFVEDRGLAPAEFVRFATLAAVADGAAISAAKLAPLIVRTFRATHILVPRRRDEMLDAGERGSWI